MSLVPANVNLTDTNRILQGADYVRDFALTTNGVTPVDLTIYTGAGSAARAEFRATVAATTVLITATVAVQGTPTNGILRMTIADTLTTGLGTSTLNGVYDVELVSSNATSNIVERVLYGTWTMDPEVTRT